MTKESKRDESAQKVNENSARAEGEQERTKIKTKIKTKIRAGIKNSDC